MGAIPTPGSRRCCRISCVVPDKGKEGYGVQCLRLKVSLVAGLFLAMMVLCGVSYGDSEPQGGLEPKQLRVCADPDNLPFSNEKLEGFENKIAALIARDLGASLSYTWWPNQRGMIRRTMNEDLCDVMVEVPKGYDLVMWTKPYYRTTYVIATLKERNLQIASLDDPRLKQLRVGVQVNTPPHEALAQRGIMGDNVEAYSLFYTPQEHPEEYPSKILDDLAAGQIDVAFVWGPWAGYYAKKHPTTPITLVPLQGGSRAIPFAFDISMGVRKRQKALKAELEQALNRQAANITAILEEYGVPLMAADTSASAEKVSEAPREGHKHEEGAHDH